MAIFTIYALFGDDIRTLSTDVNGDPTFWVFNAIVMCAFFLEIIASCIASVLNFLKINKKKY